MIFCRCPEALAGAHAEGENPRRSAGRESRNAHRGDRREGEQHEGPARAAAVENAEPRRGAEGSSPPARTE